MTALATTSEIPTTKAWRKSRMRTRSCGYRVPHLTCTSWERGSVQRAVRRPAGVSLTRPRKAKWTHLSRNGCAYSDSSYVGLCLSLVLLTTFRNVYLVFPQLPSWCNVRSCSQRDLSPRPRPRAFAFQNAVCSGPGVTAAPRAISRSKVNRTTERV